MSDITAKGDGDNLPSARHAARIYIACHNVNPGLNAGPFTPIHVGRALAGAPIPGTIGDDDGDNISAENPKYCELTALYWAWKNDDRSSHVGLMHYRRFIDFTDEHRSEKAENFVTSLKLRDYEAKATAWLDANIADYDLVLTRPHVLRRGMAENYAMTHHGVDIEICRDIIRAAHPGFIDSFEQVMERKEMRLANMFVMRRDLFDDYCAWLFPILAKVDADFRSPRYMTPYQSRRLGFVAERLFAVYIDRLLTTQPDLKICEPGIINTSRALVSPVVDAAALNGPEHVNIAFSSDLNFLPHTAAMVNSLLRHSDPQRIYNLFFLYSDIPDFKLEVFRSILAATPNFRLTCVNVGDRFAEAFRTGYAGPSSATYNRFLLFELLEGLNRLLYLDVDMIATGDVAEIFDHDIGDAKIAAVTDYIMTRSLTARQKFRIGQYQSLYDYQIQELGLTDHEIECYFNAGLILFNFAAIDVRKTGEDLNKLAFEKEYYFFDQDILNVYFRGECFKLPARYNVSNTLANRYAQVPVDNHREAMAAKKNPLIIHFASREFKPWTRVDVHFGHYYWNSLRETPFFQEVQMQYTLEQYRSRYSLRARLTEWFDRNIDAKLIAPVRRLVRRRPGAPAKPALAAPETIDHPVHIVQSPFKTGTTSMGAFLVSAGVGARDMKYRGPLYDRERAAIDEANALAAAHDSFTAFESEHGRRVRLLMGNVTRAAADFDVFSDAPMGHALIDPFVKRVIAPQSKFIWVHRDFDEWIVSVKSWELAHPKVYPNADRWNVDHDREVARCRRMLDEAYRRFALFAGLFPDDCLEVTLDDPEISAKIGAFYGVEAPEFPRKNASAA